MKIHLFFALFVGFAQFAKSATTLEHELSRDWDCLIFGVGIVDSDYYIEDPIVTVTPTKQGAFLTYRSPGKRLQESINKSKLDELLSKLSKIYSEATPPTAATDRPVPRFLLFASMNRGSNNISFQKETTPTSKKEDLESLFKLIDELFPNTRQTEQDAAANP